MKHLHVKKRGVKGAAELRKNGLLYVYQNKVFRHSKQNLVLVVNKVVAMCSNLAIG